MNNTDRDRLFALIENMTLEELQRALPIIERAKLKRRIWRAWRNVIDWIESLFQHPAGGAQA